MANLTNIEFMEIESTCSRRNYTSIYDSKELFFSFIHNHTNININKDDYINCENAYKTLVKLCEVESNYSVGIVLHKLSLCYQNDLLDRASYIKQEQLAMENQQIDKLRIISDKLNSSSMFLELPIQEETPSVILDDIEKNLSNNTPELILDRLHTFATNYLRAICQKHKLNMTNTNGNYLPLHSLMGKLKGYYFSENIIESEFTKEAIKINISVIDKYNAVRNNESFAHDNIILNKIESKYAVKTIANILVLIDEIENMINGSAADNEELPF